jgi:hypothetical protein
VILEIMESFPWYDLDSKVRLNRVPHGYGNTCGVSKMGNMGVGMVLIFGTP